MRVLLDTDICSYLLKRTSPELIERVSATKPGELAVSAVTAFELHYGVQRLTDAERWLGVVRAFLDNLDILPFDALAAREAAAVRAELARAGTPIGAYDLLIAGHARAVGSTLVTNNEREFRRVSGLRVANWLRE